MLISTKKRQTNGMIVTSACTLLNPGQKMLLFKSHLKLFPGKLRSKWSGSFKVVHMMPHGVVELWNETKMTSFFVNGQGVKHYYGVDKDHEEEAIDVATKMIK